MDPRGADLEALAPDVRPAAARELRIAARDEAVTAGLEELDLFLRDVARQGLASLRERGYAPWERASARLVDAKAPGVASLVRRVGGLVAGGGRGDWPGGALELLGRITLLVEGWRRRDALPASEVADLRTQLGGAWKAEEVLQGPGVADRWAVVGQRLEVDELNVQRTWLQGRDSGRTALILEFAYGTRSFPTSLAPATEQDAELVFGPGAWPQRALVRELQGDPRDLPALPRAGGCDGACQELARALSRNPWLERVGVGLRRVVPLQRPEGWIARDAEGALLPLDLRDDQGRVLRALSGGHPLDLFGEWDGRGFLPLAAWTRERAVKLS